MNWYNKWFGTHYYDLLYNQRDEVEAKAFLDQLVKYLNPSPDKRFLDFACGKGRHSVYLNSVGYDVTGIDLSESNIEYCKQFENDRLHFYVQDMRRVFATNAFDYILNLFTSFGYFECAHHNQLAVSAAAAALKPSGTLVIDFFNAEKVLNNLEPHYTKKIQHLEFDITKKLEQGYIIKTIKVTDDNTEKYFYEKVQALGVKEFESYLNNAQLGIVDLFGSYQLEKFDLLHSDRLIIIAQKK